MMKKFVITKLDESKYLSKNNNIDNFENDLSKFNYNPEQEPETTSTSKSKPELSKEQQEAYDKFVSKNGSITLVLMDLSMPVMDGFETITKIR